jgi:hypothetical protein
MNQFDTLMAQQQVWAAHHEALRQLLSREQMARGLGQRNGRAGTGAVTRWQIGLRRLLRRPQGSTPRPPLIEAPMR